MQKLSIRKLSILGLVLMAASAVTASVIPGKSDKKEANKFAAGSLTEESVTHDNDGGSSVTCALDTQGEGQAITAPCNASSQEFLSQTTGAGPDTSDGTISSTDNDGNNNTTSTENS